MKIKRLETESRTIYSRDGEITEFWKETAIREPDNDRKLELWYRQGNREYNAKYVIELEYEDDSIR
jgi:hypothetical protein